MPETALRARLQAALHLVNWSSSSFASLAAAFDSMLIEGFRKPQEVIADAIRHAAEHIKPRRFFMHKMRACPVCFEQIRGEARKCPHCLEPVEPLPAETEKKGETSSA